MEETVLKIVHLPAGLSNERRDLLFKKYGAVKTKTIRKSDKYTITFAEFANNQTATNVFIRLHQLNINGKRLSIEFAKKDVMNSDGQIRNQKTESAGENKVEDEQSDDHLRAFLKKLNSWTGGHIFSQPPPPNLCYKYPPPTKNTLIRIAIQLIKEPAFYTQVLHLMNRMNLPPPFIELENEFPHLKQLYNMEQYKNIFETEINRTIDESSINNPEEQEDSESEIESDEEKSTTELNIPQKRKLRQNTKRLKIPKFVNPQKQQTAPKTTLPKVVKPSDVFESVPKEARSLQINLKTVDKLIEQTSEKSDNVVSKTDEESNATSGFGLIFPAEKVDDKVESNEENAKQEFISSEQLEENRISVNDQKVLPVFKNYHAGVPSYRLYVKNLAKSVEEADLNFIFKRYITKTTAENDHEYNVRLMQEGRMKGQAFITLQNVAQAQLALSETNGFILKDKPMVVQFANAPKP